MIILITGATGYIGREFIRKYQNEFDIIALVREKSNIADIEQFNCKIIKFNDFTDINLIFQKNIIDRKSTRLNSSHSRASRMPSSA